MNEKQLYDKLVQLNDTEKKLQSIRTTVTDKKIIRKMFSEQELGTDWVININKLLLDDKYIAIHKHDRFIEFDWHSHDYIELCFVYSGEIKQIIDKKEINLVKGEMVLLDMNVKHKIYAANEKDIGINILIKKEFFDSIFMSQLSNNNIIFNFIIKAIYQSKKSKQFLYFRTSQNDNIFNIMTKILIEYYDPKISMDVVLRSYMVLLFIEILRDYRQNLEEKIADEIDYSINGEIIKFINENYKDITLKKIANHFNFNVDYMGKLIKQISGKKFTSLIRDKKLEEAAYLLENTDDSVTEIVNKIGYSNISYFYKQFKQKFKGTPDEYRKNVIIKTNK